MIPILKSYLSERLFRGERQNADDENDNRIMDNNEETFQQKEVLQSPGMIKISVCMTMKALTIFP